MISSAGGKKGSLTFRPCPGSLEVLGCRAGYYFHPVYRPGGHFSGKDCHSGFPKRLREPNMGLPSGGHAGQSTQAGFFDSQICNLIWRWLPFHSRQMPNGIHFHMTDTPAARRGPINDAMSIQLSPWSPGVPRRMDSLPAPHPQKLE